MFTFISTRGKMESTNEVHCLKPYEITKISLKQNPKDLCHIKTNIILTNSKCTDIEPLHHPSPEEIFQTHLKPSC